MAIVRTTLSLAAASHDPQVAALLGNLIKKITEGAVPAPTHFVRDLTYALATTQNPASQILFPIMLIVLPSEANPFQAITFAVSNPHTALLSNKGAVSLLITRIKGTSPQPWTNLNLAYLGDTEALAKIARIVSGEEKDIRLNEFESYPTEFSYKAFLKTVIYAGPGDKIVALKEHAKEAIFADGHWTLTMPGFTAPAIKTETAPVATPPAVASAAAIPVPIVPSTPVTTIKPPTVSAPVQTLETRVAPPAPPRPVETTIIAAAPIETYRADGAMISVTRATVGQKYQCLRVEDGRAILEDGSGRTFKIKAAAVSNTPQVAPQPTPPPAPVVSVSLTNASAIDLASVNGATFSAISNPPAATLSPRDASTLEKFNTLFGRELFTQKNLWDESARVVASRLGLPQDSQTETQSSYRVIDSRLAFWIHAKDSNDTAGIASNLINCLGSHAYSRVLYAYDNKPDRISIMFANTGDGGSAYQFGKTLTANQVQDKEEKDKLNQESIKRDGEYLDKQLSDIFGIPSSCNFGATAQIKEPSHRWDWNGTSFILTRAKDKSVSLTICPTDFADHYGVRENRTNTDDSQSLRNRLLANVQKSPNGDVLLKNIPAVNQGPKGYCIPACFESVTRYLEIPGDMYIFATAANTDAGGGTTFGNMDMVMDSYLSVYHAKIELVANSVETDSIRKYIDKGVPVLWGCWLDSSIENVANVRIPMREAVTTNWRPNASNNWDEYIMSMNRHDALMEFARTALIPIWRISTKLYTKPSGINPMWWS